MPSDVYLGGVSGLGGGTATFTPTGNLNALVFVPTSNSGWVDPGAPGQRVVQGPTGVLLQDLAGTAKVDITDGQITFSAGGHQIVISAAGVVIDGKVFSMHMHSGVQSGGSNTGPVA